MFACLDEHSGEWSIPYVHLQHSPCSALLNRHTCLPFVHPVSLLRKHIYTLPCPLQDAQGKQQQKRMDQFPVASQLLNELMAEVMVHVGRSKPLEHKLFQVRVDWAALVGCPTARAAWRSLIVSRCVTATQYVNAGLQSLCPAAPC